MEEGGALTRRDFEVGGNCLEGERGDEAGEEREEVRARRGDVYFMIVRLLIQWEKVTIEMLP